MKRVSLCFIASAFVLMLSGFMTSCSNLQDPEMPDLSQGVTDLNPYTNVYIAADVDDFTTTFHKEPKKEYRYEWITQQFFYEEPVERVLAFNIVEIDDNKPVKEKIKTFVVAEDNPYYKSIDGVLFNKDATVLICCPQDYQAEEYVVPASVEAISECAFTGNKNLKKIDLSLTGLSADKSLVITNGAFDMCDADIVYPTHHKNSYLRIATKHDYEDYSPFVTMFIGSDVSDLTDAEHKKCIRQVPVEGHTNLGELYDLEVDADDNIPKISEIHNYVVDKNNPYYMDIDGVLFSKDGTELISVPRDYQATEYVVPSSVLRISNDAFKHNKNLKKLDLSHIGNDGQVDVYVAAIMFNTCRQLTTVIFPNGNVWEK